jgi:hypothetical protein
MARIGQVRPRRRTLALLGVAATLTSATLVVTGGVAAAGTAGTVCVTTANGVQRYDQASQAWQIVHNIPFPARDFAAGGHGLVLQDKARATTIRYAGTPGQWVVIGGDFLDVTVSKDRFYANGTPSGTIFQYSDLGVGWNQIGDMFNNIYAGGGGLYATSNQNLDVYRYLGRPGQWQRIGGPSREYAVTDVEVFALSIRRDGVWRYNGSGDSWTQVGGPANRIWAGGFGLIAESPTGEIWRYLNVPNQWQHIGSRGANFAVNAHTVYGITPGRDEVVRYNPGNNTWTSLGSLPQVTAIAGCP